MYEAPCVHPASAVSASWSRGGLGSEVVRRRLAVFAVAALVGACTRDNPEFGDERTETAGDDEGSPSEADDDDGVDDVVDDDDDTGTVDDGQSSGVVDDGFESTTSTTSGGVGCEVPAPVPFDVKAEDDNLAPIPAVCGTATAWHGAVVAMGAPNRFTIAVCADATCSCEVPDELVTLTFEDLYPTPVDAVTGMSDACVALMLTRATEDNGCGVEFILVESIAEQADFPMYLATSSPAPGWSLTVPAAELGDPLDTCEVHECDGSVPGDYTMALAGARPIAPGESGVVTLNPYAGVATDYAVTTLYSRITSDCRVAIGWAAVLAP